MAKSKRNLIVVALCVAAVLSCILLIPRGPRNKEPFLAEVPMSDGIHRLRLLKIVEGPLVYDWKDPTPPLLRMLPLPSKLRPPYVPFQKVTSDGMAPYKYFGSGEKTPGYSFLFRVVDANGEYASYPGVSNLSFIESTGHEFVQPNSHMEFPGHWDASTFSRAILPRRDRQLRLRVKERIPPGKILELVVDNPAYRPPQGEWVPEALPCTKTIGGVAITLHDLRLSGAGGVKGDLTANNSGWAPQWPFSFWLEDVTGNRGQILSPFEPAWKLHAQMEPHQVEAIPSERIWAIDDVNVPAQGVEVPLNREREIDGVTLQVGKIVGGAVGSGEKRSKEDGPNNADQSGYRSDCPWFTLTAKSSHRDFQVVARVMWNGERLWVSGESGGTPLTRDMKQVFKKLPANSKVRIEIGVGRPIDVEFIVDPKEIHAASTRAPRGKKAG